MIRNALSEKELLELKKETFDLIEEARVHKEADGSESPSLKRNDPDYWYNDEMPATWYKSHSGQHPKLDETPSSSDSKEIKRGIPFRIEYPLAKSTACVKLMGHSFVLRCMEQLLETKDFIPTWDSLVFKMDGEGVPIRWHRDASAESVGFDTPAIDVGFYLDEANESLGNCLWVVPGSHKWPDYLAGQMGLHLTKDGFNKHGAVPVPVSPGDVILHNILVLHGSASSTSPLRRTVYYEYRSIDHELKYGPHQPSYMPLKQQLLVECLKERSKDPELDTDIGQTTAFVYDPSEKHSAFKSAPPISTMRFCHQDYFIPNYRG